MKTLLYFIVIALILCSCQKGFLDLKPDQTVVVPSSLKDFEALLDNDLDLNNTSPLFLSELGTDDFYLTEGDWNQLPNAFERNAYRWEPNIYEGSQCRGWNYAYHIVLYANTVLDGLAKVERIEENASQWDRIKATALFFRAWQFFQLSQIFCDDYESVIAMDKVGIPLKLTSDINEQIKRATIAEVYNKIVFDLTEASTFLPEASQTITRPTKGAVYALLSRVYLQMKEYRLALDASNLYLTKYDNLKDYNEITTIDEYSFPVIFNGGISEQPFYDQMLSTRTFDYFSVDTILLASYQESDLRPAVYFRSIDGYTLFIGSYNGFQSFNPFPATDEVYLIKAECLARLNSNEEALNTLNALLVKRFKVGTYQLKNIDNTPNVLSEIINERRKELVFRGVRWSDLRRLRTDDRFAKTLERRIGKVTYRLTPDQEKLYTFPIPDNVISISKIEQNVR